MSDWIGSGTPATGGDDTSVVVTAAEVIEEGQLVVAYFPNCADTAAMTTLVGKWITAANSRVKRQVGATIWATTDADYIRELHDCVLFFACARAWQVIANVIDTWGQEELPTEYVDSDKARENRDYYLGQATSILERYDITPGGSAYVGAFDSVDAIKEDTESVLGLLY